MGKADADRDYYADLELEPTADPNEIRKQFHKLGMILALKQTNTFMLTKSSSQLSSTIPTGTRAKRWNVMPSSKSYNPLMKY